MPINTNVEVVGPTTPQLDKSFQKWIQEVTIDVAEKTLAKTVNSQGFTTKPKVVTDGVLNRDYADVKPFGKIEFVDRPMMKEAVLYALDQLRQLSPVLTGRYVQSHIVLLNGVQITGNVGAALDRVKPDDRVQIVNDQPYARKIEGRPGARARPGKPPRKRVRGSSKQARNGVYKVVFKNLVQLYAKTMYFDLKYVKLNLNVQVKANRGKKTIRVAQVYPSINFYIKPGT